jgi:glutamyl-tRNA reductase
MDELWNVVGRSDIVYTAAFSDGYIVDKEKMMENGLARGRPMMMVDIGVPRNVGPDCNEVGLMFFAWLVVLNISNPLYSHVSFLPLLSD